jgi:hypothetical protein
MLKREVLFVSGSLRRDQPTHKEIPGMKLRVEALLSGAGRRFR